MGFDAHSLERLKQLGRTLPQPLANPTPPGPDVPSDDGKAAERRHRVETETDPAALFRELMKVSPDGKVPPHLLDRLRHAEGASHRASSATGSTADAPITGAGATRHSSSAPSRPINRRSRDATTDEERELYTTFQQLLLEGDGPA